MARQKSERELESIQNKVWYWNEILKVFIADIIPSECCKRENMENRMLELENLVSTLSWLVILKHIQKRSLPDYNTYIWSWKLDEIISEMNESWAKVLIIWNILKPHQVYNINEKLKVIWAKCWDRVDLILKIFEKNAKSEESKLQIELASIKHMWPRIFWMWMELSKQWLSRWKWETNTEIMKRHLRNREYSIREELEKYKKVRAEHRKRRERKWLLTVWIVGYTNAWKSSLLNSLTNKWVLSENKLFATLGTSVGKMWIENFWEVLLNDTIWFIRDLPPNLIEAFSSTLEDSIESEILFHVIDSSDPKIDEKIKIVDDILFKIWAHQKKVYVFNKIDLINEEEKINLLLRFKDLNPVFISSFKKINLNELKERIIN